LQLANRSIKRRRGILEDVLVKVGKFILHVDFIVLDMEEGLMPSPLPIILGRPLMRTTNTKICVKKGTMSMKLNGEKIVFMVFEESQLPQDDVECFNACMIQGVVENTFQDHQMNPLQATLTHRVTRKDKELVIEDVTKDIMKVVQPLVPSPSHLGDKRKQQLKELEELRQKADENNKLYKGRTKTNHDKYHAKEFQVGRNVWTYKSRFCSSLVSSSINGLVLVLSLTCFLRE
jgi:hypothetical protein